MRALDLCLVASLLAFAFMVGCSDGSSPTTSPATTKQPSTPRNTPANSGNPTVATSPAISSDSLAPAFVIVGHEVSDEPLKTQVETHAVVSGEITEAGLRHVLQKLFDDAMATPGLRYHGGHPTNVYIYLYSSKEHYESRAGQWIARLIKTPDSPPNSTLDSKAIGTLAAKPEDKEGRSESERQQIFTADALAEDRAQSESEAAFPVNETTATGAIAQQIKKQQEMRRTLAEKYKSEVAAHFGITAKQLEEVTKEGIEKNWPLPPQP